MAAALLLVPALLLALYRVTTALHMFQMDSYSSARYWQWLRAKPMQRLFAPPWHRETGPAKKQLDYTSRAKRILYSARCLLTLTAIGIAVAQPSLAAAVAAALLLAHLAPAAVLVANQLLRPVQAYINHGFVTAARKKIRQLQPTVIGVAGSYGKTSTKYFIDTLLSQRFRTLKTPGSVNTQLGVTRVINDTLTSEHEVFIVEMGAYQRGEVKDVADVAPPNIGIITAIGPEHFERFLTMENIEDTNYEVIDPLPPSGLAVFNCENAHCRKLADRTRHVPVIRYSLNGDDIWAEDMRHSVDGLEFAIVTRQGLRIPAVTSLVGRHNVLNILGAAAIALHLGLYPEQITAGIAMLKPAPNRLEVKKGQGGAIIIDDSYNSNPDGAAEALRVLSEFTTGKRVLVTPGMIELGVLQHEKNEELGFQASKTCDVVVLVGPEQTRPLAEGLRRGGFPSQNLHIVRDLSEATVLFQRMIRPGDVILFENDLPDLYNEK